VRDDEQVVKSFDASVSPWKPEQNGPCFYGPANYKCQLGTAWQYSDSMSAVKLSAASN